MELFPFIEAYINVRIIPSTLPTLSPVTTPPSTHTAGYSETFAKKKAYLLLKDQKIIECMNKMENDFFKTEFSRLAYKSVAVLEEIMMDYVLEERVRLQAVKEVLNFYGLEKRLEIQSDTAKQNSSVNIVFNEVPSREVTN